MQNLLKSSDYNWALFLGHLVIEKLLKALYVKLFQKHAIYSHDLLRLAKNIEIEISEDYEEWLDEITTFNLNARYDIQKQDFRKLCTKEFAEEWDHKIIILKEWLTNQL
jgi:HEPN domain-containing protein